MNNITSSHTLSTLSTLSPSPSVSLQARIEQLRLAQTPTPLWVVLHIYITATRACYMNYMEGLIELVAYLSPIELPPTTNMKRAPQVLCSYETQELAKHLGTTQDMIIHTLLELYGYEHTR